MEPVGPLVLVADGVHNFVDGVIIGASYLVSPVAGIATTIAVFVHEIPQEIGDFSLLLHAGYSRAKALFFNFLSALTAVVGTVVALWIGGEAPEITALLLAITAGGFIYIAAADLVPELHSRHAPKESVVQFVALLFGIAIMFALLLIE